MNTDYLIVEAFLLITFIVGVRAGRGIKDIREYATGSKTYSTGALVLTYLATVIGGGSMFGDTKEVFNNGVIMTAALSGLSLSYLLRVFLVSPGVKRFRECFTMGDVIEQLYGPTSKIITGFLGVLCTTIRTGIQIVALGKICGLMGVDPFWGIVLGGAALTIYSAIGGIKAVTATDILQFVVLIVVIPVATTLLVEQAGGIVNILSQVPADRFDIFAHKNFSYYFTFFLMWSFFSEMTYPSTMQRILMAKDVTQSRNMFLAVAAYDFTFRIVIMLMGLAGLVLYPTIAGSELVAHIVNDALPVEVRGLVLCGIVAMVMSSADSSLHAAGLTLSHDFLSPLLKKMGVGIDELKCARYGTLIIGIGTIIVGLQAKNLLRMSLFSLQATGPALIFPLLAGFWGVKPTKGSFYAALVGALVTFGLASWLLPAESKHLAALISIIANGVIFFVTHIIQHGGIVVVDVRRNNEVEEKFLQLKREAIADGLKNYLPTPGNIVRYSRWSVEKYGAPYVLFGLFCCANYTIPYFMWADALGTLPVLRLYLRLVGAVLCALLIVRDKWPRLFLPYLSLFWHLTLLYCIPFTSTVMFLLTQGSMEWLMNVAATITFLILLVDSVAFIILSVLGIALGFLFHALVIGPINFQLDLSGEYMLVYQCFFATLIGLIFARRKQQQVGALTDRNQILTLTDQENKADLIRAFQEKTDLLNALEYAGIKSLLRVVKLSRNMYLEARKQENESLLKRSHRLQSTLIPIAAGLRGIHDRAARYIRLAVEEHPIHQILHQVHETLKSKALDEGVTYQVNTRCEALQCDAKEMHKLLVNGIELMQKQCPHKPIFVVVEDTELHYPLSSFNNRYNKKLAALRFAITTQEKLPKPDANYVAVIEGDSLHDSKSNEGLTLTKNELITMAHYGYAQPVRSRDTLCYVLPIKLREVRSKDQDQACMEVATKPVRANDLYKGAQEQESAFFKDVEERTDVDIELVKIVLELIKWYHGPVKRKSGEPFYLHPLAVAHIVMDYNTDEATIVGALMHDMVEDTPMLLEDIEGAFGADTAEIVRTVTHMESHEDRCYKIKLSAEESLEMLEKAGDKRALYVKIADRLHNMRTIGAKRYESQVRTAQETLHFFVPKAESLGLEDAARELERLSLVVFERKQG